jgi:F-type H+-transporting ATPase subunit gamma
MPSLKSLKIRITSVKSTQKITKAMKMVAASKLRRAQEAAEAARPYAERMDAVMQSLGGKVVMGPGVSPLLAGTGSDKVHLLVVTSSERGLCGGFNTNIVKAARAHIERLLAEGKQVKLLTVGKKAKQLLTRSYASLIVGSIELAGIKKVGFGEAQMIAADVLARFQAGEFDVAWLYYSKFKSAISQIPTGQQLIPVPLPQGGTADASVVEYEPDEEQILNTLLPRNIGVQVFRALLENAASEQGARMAAMDNATRNAGDMIKRLTLTYNRTRQAAITKELIEIISGAEAL